MNLALWLSGFISGFTSCILASTTVVLMYFFSLRTKGKKLTEENKLKQADHDKKYETIKPRLQAATQIGEKQMELLALTQQPSMNALHSRHKNGLMREVQALEDEKRAILRSILKEGFDPNLNVLDNRGTQTVIKLSDYMAEHGIPLEDTRDAEAPKDAKAPADDPNAQVRKVGKFFVIKGGKDDKTH